MFVQLDRFIHAHRPVLLSIYLACLALLLVFFIVHVVRWARVRERIPSSDASLSRRRAPPPIVTIEIGLLLVLLSVPFLLAQLPDPLGNLRTQPGLWIAAMLPLAGLALCLTGMRRAWTERRTRNQAELSVAEFRPGGTVAGRLLISGTVKNPPRVTLHLVLQGMAIHRWLSGERNIFEAALWHTNVTVQPKRLGGCLVLPFCFRLPSPLPQTPPGWPAREWLLVAEAPELGTRVTLLHTEHTSGRTSNTARTSLGKLFPPQHGIPKPPHYRTHMAPLARLSLGLGIALAPWLFWFAIEADDRPWAHLADTVPSLLGWGFIAMCLFATALFGLLQWALAPSTTPQQGRPDLSRSNDPGPTMLARHGLRLALAGDLLILAWFLWWWHTGFELDIPWQTLLTRTLMGLFVWAGLLGLLATLFSLRHGRSE